MNHKSERAVRLAIQDVLEMHETKEESLKEMLHYMDAFPKEIDYNIASYGNVRIYYDDCRAFFRKCGYKSAETATDNQIWLWYRWYIGKAADKLRNGR